MNSKLINKIGAAGFNPSQSTGFWRGACNRFCYNYFALGSLIFILVLAILCIIIPLISRHEYSTTDFANSLIPPNSMYWFGSDGLGRDLFVRCFIGGRITFEIAVAATVVVLFIGVMYGSIAGFLGGKIDNLMMRIVDVLYGIPFLFFSILLLALFGQSLVLSFVAIAAISWLDMARVVRGQTLSLRNREFVEAAYICGVSKFKIITRHIIPNLIGVVIVYAALVVPNMIVLSAVLSFFGLGVMEPMTSWGLLISDGSKNMSSWWLLLFPALLMLLTLLAFTFVANGLRDALDSDS
ncbi:MAG: oligopeptide transport system permease protein [Pseudomonadota bacterium]|nr:oligopeptide transport system permease protein [Pseudomonadota bacterium]